MADTERQRYCKRRAGLARERQSYESHWQELADWILPQRVYLNNPTARKTNAGAKANQKIIDGTATYAARTLTSGMMAGLTSPSRPWFRLTTPYPQLNEQSAVKQWLYETEVAMREVFSRSNIYSTFPMLYGDIGVFGTSAALVLDDPIDTIRGYHLLVGTYYLAQNARFEVDTLYRDFALTVRQVVQQFGMAPDRPGVIDWTRISDQVKRHYENGRLDEPVDICQVIEPNAEYKIGSRSNREFRFRSCYFEVNGPQTGTDTLLQEGGFEEFPVLAPRWTVNGEDVYGRSPGMDALGDVKQLQKEQKLKLQALDKVVNPPMNGPLSLRAAGGGSLLPGDVNWYDAATGQQQFTPAYIIKPDLNYITADIEQVRYQVRRAFYEDLFLMLQQAGVKPGVTAREIDERAEEKLLVLGPVVERQAGDLLDPLIDRTFAIMGRQGLLPEPPEEIQGLPLRVEYISTMAQAQRMVGTAGIERTVAFAASIASANPEVLDVVDFDQAVQDYASMVGVPPAQIRDDETIAAIRAQRQQQQALMAAAQQAKPVADAAKAASETSMEGDSALTRFLGRGQAA